MNLTQAERELRWGTCIRYLRQNELSIPDAVRAAERDGVTFPNSDWLTALSPMIMLPKSPTGPRKPTGNNEA